jgi:hypothetical protein
MMQNYYKEPRGPKRLFIFLFFAAAAAFALAAVVMLLWNAILPPLLKVNRIGYWQALGLLVLCKILFGSFRGGKTGKYRPFGGPPAHLKEKWMSMSEAEKQQFREAWKKRCAERKG